LCPACIERIVVGSVSVGLNVFFKYKLNGIRSNNDDAIYEFFFLRD